MYGSQRRITTKCMVFEKKTSFSGTRSLKMCYLKGFARNQKPLVVNAKPVVFGLKKSLFQWSYTLPLTKNRHKSLGSPRYRTPINLYTWKRSLDLNLLSNNQSLNNWTFLVHLQDGVQSLSVLTPLCVFATTLTIRIQDDFRMDL